MAGARACPTATLWEPEKTEVDQERFTMALWDASQPLLLYLISG